MKLETKPRIIYNDDSCTLRTAPPPHTPETIACALDYLKGTQVDCLCWCVGDHFAYGWPSKVLENECDMKAKCPDYFASWPTERDIMYSLYLQGINFLPLLIQKAHAQGLMFVASLRMNDTHVKSYPNSFFSPEFWRTHQEYRIWDATDAKGYYNAALDYSFPEVRGRFRDVIMELAGDYDVDGIELDFTRSPYFFAPSEAWRKRSILTRFVREIRQRLDALGKQRKRPYSLILRVASRDRALTTAGIDLEQWIKEKLPSILVVSELINNFNQGIEPWRTLCAKAGVLLYPAVEAGVAYMNADFYTPLIRNVQAPRHDGGGLRTTPPQDIGIQRAAAQNLLAQQPDGLYMFNFPCRLAEGNNIMHTDKARFQETISLLREMGSLKTLAKKDKYYAFYKDLPIYVEANRPRRFHQTIPFAIRGKDISAAQITLRFRQIAERNPHADGNFRQNPIVKPGVLKYYLNDQEIAESELQKTRAPAGAIPSGFQLKAHEIVELRIPGNRITDGVNTLAFEMPHFPQERDPYVYIYNLEAEVTFDKK